MEVPPKDAVFSVAREDILRSESAEPGAGALLKALLFAAEKHSGSLRKTSGPYINHPIAVAELLANIGNVEELTILQAALLHDVLEDTPTLPETLSDLFGPSVCSLVQEVTDEMTLPKEQRKRLQIETAPRLSAGARQIRIADKIANVADITTRQPRDWSLERKCAYLDWAVAVVNACRGCNGMLETYFDAVVEKQRAALLRAG